MKFEEMDLTDMPMDRKFIEMVDRQGYLWEMYRPTTVEKDIPFEQDWWKFVYWMPKLKKDFYVMAMSSPDFNKALIELCNKYGMDFWFFEKHYKFLIKRMEWMRKSGMNHIGEITK